MQRTSLGPLVAFGLLTTLLGTLVAFARNLDDALERQDLKRFPKASQSVEPIAPSIPASVVAALQEGKITEALQVLNGLAKAEDVKATDRAYFALIQGIAFRLDQKFDEARTALRGGIEIDPDGPWTPKLRFESARLELTAGQPAAAEQLARSEVLTLLDASRKDELAQVYVQFANALLKPENPNSQADPNAAYLLLSQARDLAKGASLRAQLLFRMGEASQLAADPNRAIQNFQDYLREYPDGVERPAARFHLGEAQLAAGQLLPARLTWNNLVRELEKANDPAARDLRARAMFQIAITYGFPNPPDDASLNLGLAALHRFLESYPNHAKSIQARLYMGLALMERGRTQDALDAFRQLVALDSPPIDSDDSRRELAESRMSASFLIGRLLQQQGRYDQAIEAFKSYLAQYPDGSQSADAQREILNSQLLIASEKLRLELYEQARDAWQTFTAQNPLDPRVPELLYQLGESYAKQDDANQAIIAWETLIGKFPRSEPAAHAEFSIGLLLENRVKSPEKAIERYRKVVEIGIQPWADQARQNIAVMESKALTVITPRTFRSGEIPFLKISTRNLEKLTFTAYKLNPEAYFRKKQNLTGVESLDIGLVAPDAEWNAEVPEYGKYKPLEHDYKLEQISVPGVFVIKVTDEKSLQATTLVVGSDLDAIVKVSRDQLLVFAQNMKTGEGIRDARVLVASNNRILIEQSTGEDGVLVTDWPEPRVPGEPLTYLVLEGSNVAGSGLGIPQQVAQGLSARAYLYTDRPAYRPGQTVELRGVVREIKDGQYDHAPGSNYNLQITDSRGRHLVDRSVTLSNFGTFHTQLQIDSGSPIGTYSIRLHQPGKSEFSGSFEVQSYQLQKVGLEIDLPRTVFFRGEKIEGKAIARYFYGTPAGNRPITLQLPDGRTLTGHTAEDGSFQFTLETDGFAEEQTLAIQAMLPEDGVGTAISLMLAVREYQTDLSTVRDVYLDDESFRLIAKTVDVLGKPMGQSVQLEVLKQVRQNDASLVERLVQELEIKTDPVTGEGSVSITIDDDEGGSYVLRAKSTDRFGNPIISDKVLTISGSKDENRLRLITDRKSWKVGENASVRLINRVGEGSVLLTWEADRILHYKVQKVKPGDNPLSWQTDNAQFPNFTLSASRMYEDQFHQARLDLSLIRDLQVSIVPQREQVEPGDDIEVTISTKDQLGRPVSAEVSLALIDEALLKLYGDNLPPIGPFFYNQSRLGAFQAESTNTFRYAPTTEPVSEAVVEEAERQLMDQLAGAELDAVREKAKDLASHADFAPPQPGQQAPPPAAPAMADAFGGRGGGVPALSKKLGELEEGRQEMILGRVTAPGREPSGNAPAEAQLGLFDASQTQLAVTDGAVYAWGVFDDKPAAGVDRRARGYLGEFVEGVASTTTPRQQFVETAYWNPSIVTNDEGSATVTLKAPPSLSKYRFTARGVTGQETLTGQSTAELRVEQDFFVELKAPGILTQNDRPKFMARVHHKGIQGKADLRLRIYASGSEQVFPRTVNLEGDMVEEILFEPYEVPDAEAIELTLEASVSGKTDSVTLTVPVRPWGVQALDTKSGTANDDTTVFLTLPPGRAYQSVDLQISLSPTLQRMLVELALGPDFAPLASQPRFDAARLLPPPSTIADRASDLIAAAAALDYLRKLGGSNAPESTRLANRIRGLASELVTLQNEDGGWPWIPGRIESKPGSDPITSARALWALAMADSLGMLSDETASDRAVIYVEQEYARLDAADHDGRAALLHALSTRRKASFEQANRMNRERQNLSDAALAYLAITFANLDRSSLGAEVLGILGPRSKTEVPTPGGPVHRYWEGGSRRPACEGPAEATSLAAFAYARIRPEASELSQSVAWLLAHRLGLGWQPLHARGPALLALGAYYSRAQAADDAYQLSIRVNEKPILTTQVQGQTDGQILRVPREVLERGGQNKVEFDFDGRGTYGYSISLTGFTQNFGPEQDRHGKPFILEKRVYLAAEPEFDGKTLPTGFGVAVNPSPFDNLITQVALGRRSRVRLESFRNIDYRDPVWQRDFVVLEEYIPTGVTLVPGSINTNGLPYDLVDNQLTVYCSPDQPLGVVTYDVFGYLPGDYQALPARVRDAYDPARVHLGIASALTVLDPGKASNDPYTPTPDELYARGKALYEAHRYQDALEPLEALWTGYTLRDDVAKDAARLLLTLHIKQDNARKIVEYFEVLREKAPEVLIPFDEILPVGRAYRAIDEPERAYLVWLATAEASYLEDARVGEVLRQQGKTLEGLAFLLQLWREYPNSASIESDFFGLSQLLGSLATRAREEPEVRRELALAALTPPQLTLQSIQLVQVFLALSPKNPLADEASLAMVNAYLDLGDDQTVVDLAQRFAQLYPQSKYLDSFQYSEALGRFHLGQYDRAITVAETIANALYKDENGADIPSPNKWQALYILGQIYHARRNPAKAVEYYQKVADRFTDAAGAVTELTRTQLSLREVTVIRPGELPRIAAQGEPAVQITLTSDAQEAKPRPKVDLDYRNIAEADVKVYPVDLMRLYLTRRNLDGIAGIDLAGITPLVETQVKLGDGKDYTEKHREIPLPLESEGAFLVMVRGDDLYASGIALVSPLELEILEERESGRVRVTVRDADTGDYVSKVQVKVIGSDNESFISGETDLRGVFVAEGIRGLVTAVARKNNNQYAFYRGDQYVGTPPTPASSTPSPMDEQDPQQQGQSLEQNLYFENRSNQLRQIERLQERFRAPEGKGVQVEKAY